MQVHTFPINGTFLIAVIVEFMLIKRGLADIGNYLKNKYEEEKRNMNKAVLIMAVGIGSQFWNRNNTVGTGGCF